MKRFVIGTALATAAMWWVPRAADACGGFFCGQQPVDQQAERIVFAVNDDSTVTMVVQVAYQGDAEDFAWVLPLAEVPEAESLDLFPQAALVALDANTGPQFVYPNDPACFGGLEAASADGGGGQARNNDDVDVFLRETVGPFDVAVIGSEDPQALVSWLRDNEFRVTTAMEPYIGIYTAENMKLLALRLQPGREVNEIEPLRFTLPGEVPSIPLRLTALAAEPEMGVAVFILGDMRFGPAGAWQDVTVDPDQIVWRPFTWPLETNWTALVARAVDEVDGKGFVTEFAGSTANYIDLLRRTMPVDPEQAAAQQALLELMEPHPYLSRLYTRLSAEEMTSDPTFKRVGGGDVDRTVTLPRFVNGKDLCEFPNPPVPTPCDFTSCGAGGLCRPVDPGVFTAVSSGMATAPDAACACVPGATARTTFDPQGRATVVCQDMRMSFLNPGDQEAPGEAPLPDPCVGFDCGAGGTCVAMNMTPTCQCEPGLVAAGWLDADSGARRTRCVEPTEAVPADFYDGRLPSLPTAMPGGRIVEVPAPVGSPSPSGGGGCAVDAHRSNSAAPLWALGLGLGIWLGRRRRR